MQRRRGQRLDDDQLPFGRVVGINSGWSGTVMSAACNGPCGQPPKAPVDLVVLIDRTASMSDADVTATRDAARAILGVYDPALQRVALGFLGLSSTSTTCCGPAARRSQSPRCSRRRRSRRHRHRHRLGPDEHRRPAARRRSRSRKPTAPVNTDVLVAGIAFAGGTANTSRHRPVGSRSGGPTRRRPQREHDQLLQGDHEPAAEPASYAWNFTLASNGNPQGRAAGGHRSATRASTPRTRSTVSGEQNGDG